MERQGVYQTGELYDASYYGHHCGGIPYGRSEHWLNFFGTVADSIVSEIAPSTTLDVGCAHGFLVEALRDRGVDARGIDISHYAIEQVRDDIREYCSVGNILEPLEGRYDLVTCVEVLEHLEEADAFTAIKNLCSVTDDVVFTSSPIDFREETHINVRPAEYWSALFARAGFIRDIEFDGNFITWWAMRFRRSQEPIHRIVTDYEREVWRLKHANRERNAVVLEQFQKITDLTHQLKPGSVLEAEITDLKHQLSEAQARIEALAQAERTLKTMQASRSWRVAARLSRLFRAVRR